ncbi:T3SS (YopN, CesT) and YbjN peptide-binding chaperone 1 [Demetria terragena]|uniref:T3SS (YopN, CesT) and YbjN peptide-binding chaperone 1 n=1 Tax=Demetria terragena TaxID=63959 RepID=UPI0012E9BFEE|nr:hypothetical protein [Demetria terragena]
MTDRHAGRESWAIPWRQFESRLAALAQEFGVGTSSGDLTFSAPARGGLIALKLRRGELRVAGGPWSSESEVTPVEAAQRLCAVLRTWVPHPALITVRAAGVFVNRVAALRLADSGSVGEDAVGHRRYPACDATQVGAVSDEAGERRAALDLVVLDHLRMRCGHGLTPDEDGDLAIEIGGVGMWIRASPDASEILVFRPIAQGVPVTHAAGAEAEAFNRQHVWSRLVRRGQVISHVMEVPADPFSPDLLDQLLLVFAHHHREVRRDLLERWGDSVVG